MKLLRDSLCYQVIKCQAKYNMKQGMDLTNILYGGLVRYFREVMMIKVKKKYIVGF